MAQPARSKDTVIFNLSFGPGTGLVQVLLADVAHVSDLRYNFFPEPTLVMNGHTF